MATTYLDLQDQALSDDFSPGRFRPIAKQAILDAIGEIARQVRLPFNEATYNIPVVSGTASYALPVGATTFVRILSVYDATNHDPLAEVGADVLDDLAPSNGRPAVFSLYNNQITLYPTPNTTPTVTVRYLRVGGAPSNDTDQMATVTGIPEDYLHGLVEYARHRMFRLEDDAEMSAFWKNEWLETLRKLKGDVQRRNVGRKRQVPGMRQGQCGPRFTAP